VHTTQAVRLEARDRFFEQYNRQQLLLAEQASRSVEGLFDTFRRELGLVVSLFENGEVTRGRAREVRGSLARVYESLKGTGVIDLAVVDRAGTIVTSFPPSPHTLGVSLAFREYFAWARDKGRPGEMYLAPLRRMVAGAARGERALVVVEGIYGTDGKFDGLALFAVNFGEIARKHILSLRIGEHGYAWLMDSNNRTVLVHPQGRVDGQSFEEVFLPRWPRLYSLLIAMGDGRPGTGRYEFEDPVDPTKTVRKLLGYAPVRIGDHLWMLGVSTPEREVEALLSSFLRRQEAFSTTLGATMLAGAAVLFTLLVGWNRMLLRQVAVRTRDLAEARAAKDATFEELLAAKKLAAAGQLALGLTHEIRNPLSAIRMNVQMIREESPSDGPLRENFAIVEEEIQRLNRLLSDVMGFARPRPLRLVPADLGDEVRRVVRLMGRLLAEEAIAVDVQVDGDLRTVLCDPEQIHQVILNLVLNAVDAMSEAPGPKRLSVAAVRQGDMAFLRVTDTGVGVRAEDRDRIFDPFFTTKAQGGGLGLPTLQSIVLRHGGAVEVESGGQAGTTFTVRLPVGGPAVAETQGRAGTAEARDGGERRQGSGG
jgi:two-component system C4-dicarboxylate transport sensor histidine kinase DctB